jgi:SnoaL-like domain
VSVYPSRSSTGRTEHVAANDEAARVLASLWDLIGAQQWDRISELLDAEVRISYVHTGEVFDGEGFVRLNRDYPGSWHVDVLDTVADGHRAVSRARLSDGQETYWVASFATTRDGRITELTEVWTDGGQEPPPGRRGS